MLFKLKTGQVSGYSEGQTPLIYLISAAQAVAASHTQFVFTDGHGLASFTNWFDDLARLDAVDWPLLGATYWNDTLQDNDRQRRKQAEFLVWQSFDWRLIGGIRVLDEAMKLRVEGILARYPSRKQVPVRVDAALYY